MGPWTVYNLVGGNSYSAIISIQFGGLREAQVLWDQRGGWLSQLRRNHGRFWREITSELMTGSENKGLYPISQVRPNSSWILNKFYRISWKALAVEGLVGVAMREYERRKNEGFMPFSKCPVRDRVKYMGMCAERWDVSASNTVVAMSWDGELLICFLKWIISTLYYCYIESRVKCSGSNNLLFGKGPGLCQILWRKSRTHFSAHGFKT